MEHHHTSPPLQVNSIIPSYHTPALATETSGKASALRKTTLLSVKVRDCSFVEREYESSKGRDAGGGEVIENGSLVMEGTAPHFRPSFAKSG